MKNFKDSNLFLFLSGLIGVLVFTISFFLIGRDVLLMKESILSSLFSNSFFLCLSFALLVYTIFYLKEKDLKTKNIIYSFGISYVVLILSFVALIFITSSIYDANLSEAPLFAILFLPVVFLYSFVYSLSALIYSHALAYTFFYNFILSLFLLISAYFHWWIFPWFLIFLIFHFFVSILKKKKRDHNSM